ncbi:MAG: polysaccharide biosynthesis C-terminal domain-containing protein [Ruminococcus sp.]
MFASALRAMGNSKTPLTAMIIASVLNVSLDILLWQASGWGVAGAAIATVIAQSFSAVYCFLILRRIDIVHLSQKQILCLPPA